VARGDGRVERLRSTATVLGMFSEWDCEEGETRLEAGDALLVYSDGVTEAEDCFGDEFGEARVAGLLAALRKCSATEIMRQTIQAVQRHSGRARNDDVTVMAGRAH
jgi:sigma-B regulation protein RsbU (phosphoserine phosphatase)